MSISSTKIVSGLVADLSSSILNLDGLDFSMTVSSDYWTVSSFVVISDSSSNITSSNVTFSTIGKRYGVCPVSTLS